MLEAPSTIPNDDVVEEKEELAELPVVPIEGVAPDELPVPDGGPGAIEALDVMADMIYRQTVALGWCHPSIDSSRWSGQVVTGVTIRSKYGAIRSCPCEHSGFKTFEDAVRGLNARSAINIRSKPVDVAFRNLM